MVFKKILVPVDGSQSSLQSLHVVALLAKATRARVTVVHVLPPPADIAPDAEPAGELDYAVTPDYGSIAVKVGEADEPEERAMASVLERRADAIVSDARAGLAEEGVEIRTDVIRYQEPAEAILKLADEGWYGLIVLGNGEDDRWELNTVGQVAQEVARKFPRAVLIMKRKGGLSRLSVVVEREEDGEVLDEVIDIALAFGSEVSILAIEGQEEGAADTLLRSFLQKAADRGLSPKGSIVAEEGRPVVEEAVSGQSQLLVMRRPRVGPVGRALHRKEWVYEVLDAAPCAVMLVP